LALGEADAIKTKAQADADATIIRANAEAQALKAIAEALSKDKNLLTYSYIQKLSPSIRAMLVPNNAPFILPVLDTTTNEFVSPTEAAPVSPIAPATPTPTRTITGTLATTPSRTPPPTGR
jgi:hypothetical protein